MTLLLTSLATLLLLLWGTAPQATPPPPFTIGAQVRVTAEPSVKVRQGPGTQYEQLGSLAFASVGVVLAGPEQANGVDWYKLSYSVEAGAREGWVSGAYLELVSDPAATVPATPAAPAGLVPGGQAVVRSDGRLNVRRGAGQNKTIIEQIENGTPVTILSGPVAADGFDWYEVRYAAGAGWVAGQYLVPAPATAGTQRTTALPASPLPADTVLPGPGTRRGANNPSTQGLTAGSGLTNCILPLIFLGGLALLVRGLFTRSPARKPTYLPPPPVSTAARPASRPGAAQTKTRPRPAAPAAAPTRHPAYLVTATDRSEEGDASGWSSSYADRADRSARDDEPEEYADRSARDDEPEEYADRSARDDDYDYGDYAAGDERDYSSSGGGIIGTLISSVLEAPVHVVVDSLLPHGRDGDAYDS